jgi:hypothetical protein
VVTVYGAPVKVATGGACTDSITKVGESAGAPIQQNLGLQDVRWSGTYCVFRGNLFCAVRCPQAWVEDPAQPPATALPVLNL